MSRARRRRALQRRLEAATAQALAEGKLRPGEYYELPVRHQDGCKLLSGAGDCNCKPDIGVPERVPRAEEN